MLDAEEEDVRRAMVARRAVVSFPRRDKTARLLLYVNGVVQGNESTDVLASRAEQRSMSAMSRMFLFLTSSLPR